MALRFMKNALNGNRMLKTLGCQLIQPTNYSFRYCSMFETKWYSSNYVVWTIKAMNEKTGFERRGFADLTFPDPDIYFIDWRLQCDQTDVFRTQESFGPTQFLDHPPPRGALCRRLILKQKRISDSATVAEISHCVRLDDCLDMTAGLEFDVPIEKIYRGDHIVHAWLDFVPYAFNGYNDETETKKSRGGNSIFLPDVLAGTNAKYSDMSIKIGDEKSFHVHRMVLSAISPVFDAMFANVGGRSIKIDDIDVPTFESLLHYVYTEKLPENFELRSQKEFFDLTHAAEKYKVNGLLEQLQFLFILRNSTDQERLEQLELADRYGMNNLKLICELLLSTKLSVFSTGNNQQAVLVSPTMREIITEKMTLIQVVASKERGGNVKLSDIFEDSENE